MAQRADRTELLVAAETTQIPLLDKSILPPARFERLGYTLGTLPGAEVSLSLGNVPTV
jgi:hypothetical protein